MRKSFSVGMLAMVLVLGMVLVGCATTPPFDPADSISELQGSWVSGNGNFGFTFSGNNFTYFQEGTNTAKFEEVYTEEGTFTITKSLGTVYLKLKSPDGKKNWSAPYSFDEDGKLHIEKATHNWEHSGGGILSKQ
jgi:hypothetical protein